MSKLVLWLLFCSVVLWVLGCQSVNDDQSGVVVKVADGDTVTVKLDNGKRLSVRLAAIDAPESKQAYGSHAKAALSRLVLNKRVSLRMIELDHYGRAVAVIHIGNTDINLMMLESGHAWLYRDYTKWMQHSELARYEQAEAGAMRYRRGIWSNSRPQAPWSYRRRLSSK